MENTIIARNFKFENKELTKATTAIAKATESAAKSLMKIASVMAEVDARSLYIDDFKTIADYGKEVFGYKKSAVYNMVRVGRDYIDPTTGKSIFALENGEDFTFNQLTRLLPLPSVEDAEHLIADETITPDMTLRDIESVVKAYNKEESAEAETEEAAEAETEEAAKPDEFALNFLNVKTSLDCLIELLQDDPNTAEILTEMKSRIVAIENAVCK